jgi:hypothetical protein
MVVGVDPEEEEKKDKKDKPEKKSDVVLKRHRERLGYLRAAQEASQNDDITKAVQNYTKYLGALAQFYEVTEPKLRPDLFDQNRDVAEILLISNVYWDMSKAYDRSPKLQKESERCLDQFVKFSLGYKFQYINAQMLRKYIKKKYAYNPKAFQRAYDKIAVQSNKCYVATYCYGESHPKTNLLRKFKRETLAQSRPGLEFIHFYYRWSPKLVSYFSRHPFQNRIFRSMTKMLSVIVIKFLVRK